jgi:hypothetical protein
MKRRKPRGIKLNGQPSQDMCSCYSFGCDPMSMSREFNAKMDRRYNEGVHRACGTNPCSCKSNSDLPKRAKQVVVVPGEITEEVVLAIRIDRLKTIQHWADLLDVDKQVVYDIRKYNTYTQYGPRRGYKL